MRLGFCMVALFVTLLLAGCHSRALKQPDTSLRRAAPSHVHWLQKQSMLAEVPGLINQVSQSGRLWLQPAKPDRHQVLLEEAPTWLLLPKESPPYFVTALSIVPELAGSGIRGLYLGQTGERPSLWHKAGQEFAPASLQFDPAFGSERDFEKLAQLAEDSNIQLGSTLLGAATGKGPDFFLQTRNVQGYAGLYAMLAVPDDHWGALPKVVEEESQPLSQSLIAQLAEAGIIPARLQRDALPWASPGGWAATGEIMGSDGVTRRWLYRYDGTVETPVLAWHDPSGAAAQLFSAAIILNTGLSGQTLTGISVASLMALEPEGTDSLAPGLDCLNELASQVHRYGGWALQCDPLPTAAMAQILAGASDFCRDDVTEALVAFGYHAADGRPVAQLYRDWIKEKFPVFRLARGLNGEKLPDRRILAGRGMDSHRDSSESLTIGPDKMKEFLMHWRVGLPGLAFIGESPHPKFSRLLTARKEAQLALGIPTEVIRGRGGGFGLTSLLPKGQMWLLACNFGRNRDQIELKLPSALKKARNAISGEEIGEFNGQIFRLELDGHTAQNILFTEN